MRCAKEPYGLFTMRKLYTSQKTLDRAFRSNACNAWFVLLLVLVLSEAVLVLVLEANQYSNPACWSASYRKPPRSTIGNAAVPTAIEYEYRFTEYEYEYDEIRCDVRRPIC